MGSSFRSVYFLIEGNGHLAPLNACKKDVGGKMKYFVGNSAISATS